ncbi:hypothetical protein [Chitinophaga japonensis]|uniref:Uncharacterized protein n=1 Tax=Chitinophaga japonensis TaxID=104662 RepID=A0A562SU83_CHIJA|nr:hypothetical protein [Chitinophaga japonensis]TWI84240.1 hypothetical protein LX66_4604 [Chitinophaga japonensis]
MKIGQRFNKLTLKEYFFYIDNYKKYTDFNILGLYRSIIENDKLDITSKIEVREYTHKTFKKSFDFLQLKDPQTYFDIITIGKELTQADENQIWSDIINNQQKILADKKIKHRNFGIYSKHSCGYSTCPLNGLMIRQGALISERFMHFNSDKNEYAAKNKSDRRRADRKRKKQTIQKNMSSD